MTQNESNPYVGPRPFERKKEDSARFFGRSHETQEIVSLIFGHPVTLVYAQSGAGKTSLFNASVAVNLEENGFEVLPLTRVGGVVPQEIALDEIQNLYIFNALLKMNPVSDPRTLLSKSLSKFLELRVRATDENDQPLPRAIIFDQFEELFTYTPRDWREQRKGFFLQVVEALNADPLLRVVFVIREDYLAELDPYARDLPERLRIRYRLERLGEDAALRAIKNPLVNTSRHFAPDVAEKLIEGLLAARAVDATGNTATVKGQYVEPVQLQVVCVTLWESLGPEVKEIQQEHLKDFDVNSALSNFYTSAVADAAKEKGVEELHLRNWFEKTLITPMGTRSTVFQGKESTGGIPNSAVDYLESRHIIRAEFRAGVRWYELTHDRFIEAILADNKEWFAKRREAMVNPLKEPAREWKRLGKDEGSLLRGAALNEMDNWAEAHKSELDDDETEFLAASWALYEKELEAKTRSEKRLRALVTGLGGALIFAVVAIFFAINRANYASERADFASTQQAIAEAKEVIASNAQAVALSEAQKAEEQRQAADVAREEALAGKLALQAISNLKIDSDLGLLLAIEANKLRHTPETDNTLRQALQTPQTRKLTFQSTVNALAFSPDGKYLVTGTSNGVVTLWDVTTGEEFKRLGEENDGIPSVKFIVFDPDGISFATGRVDGSVEIWPMQTLLEEGLDLPVDSISLEGLTSDITSLVFSPDGQHVAAASIDGSTLIWGVFEEKPVSLEGHSDSVNALAFNPSGDRIVTASADKNAIIWDALTGEKIFTLAGHTDSINAVSFSPDGNFIATAGDDTFVRIWDPATGREIGRLIGHTDDITEMVFNSVSGLLATAGTDNTVRFWNIVDATNNGEAPPQFELGFESDITSLTFSPDGQFLAITCIDGKTRLWNVPNGEFQTILEGHTSSVDAAVFNPEGTLLATTSSDNTVRIWDVQGSDIRKILAVNDALVWDIEFTPDGTLMASKDESATLLWDFEAALNSEDSGENRIEIGEPGSDFGFGLDISHDGKLLATTSVNENGQGSTVKVFDITDPFAEKLVWSHSFEEEVAVNLDFNTTGNLLAISTINESEESTSREIRLWDIKDDQEIDTLPVPGEYPFGLAFSPDGTLLAASGVSNSGQPGTIRFWKVSDIIEGKNDAQPVSLFSSGGAVLLAFNPSGTLFAAGGSDGIVRLWDVENIINNGDTTELAVLSGHEGIVIGLAFSADGQQLASSDETGSIRVWDVNKAITANGTDTELLNLRGEGGSIYSVAFSPDGNLLLSSGTIGEIEIWPINVNELISLGCDRLTRNLTQAEWENYLGKEKEYQQTCDNLPYHKSALEEMIQKGKALANQDKLDEAMALWNRVQDLDPTMDVDQDKLLAEVFVEKGFEYVQNEKYDQALDILQKAIELDPSLDFKPGTKIAQWIWEIASQIAPTGDYDQVTILIDSAALYDPDINFILSIGKTVRGEFDIAGGDLWIFEGTSGQEVSIQMRDDNSGLDTYLTLLGPTGELISNDDLDGTNSQIDYEITETGTYMIITSGFAGQGGSYVLTIVAP